MLSCRTLPNFATFLNALQGSTIEASARRLTKTNSEAIDEPQRSDCVGYFIDCQSASHLRLSHALKIGRTEK